MIPFFIFLLGTIFGSFYLVIGTRLPLKDNIITGRSRCDNCHHELMWYELIPIFSYLIQRGKCNYCHQKININHLGMEIITGILFIVGYFYFGLSLKYATYLVILSVALIIFVSDFKYMIILDSPIIIGSILIIIIRYFEVGLTDTLFSILNGIIFFILMYLIGILGKYLFKKESLGGGDIKLAFFIGLSLGYRSIGFPLSLIAILFSAFLALPYALTSLYLNKKNELPYGPFLIFATLIVFIFLDKFTRLLVFFNLG